MARFEGEAPRVAIASSVALENPRAPPHLCGCLRRVDARQIDQFESSGADACIMDELEKVGLEFDPA